MGAKRINNQTEKEQGRMANFDFDLIDVALSPGWLSSKAIDSEHTIRRLVSRCREEIVKTNPPKMETARQIRYIRRTFDRLVADLETPESSTIVTDENEVARICLSVLKKKALISSFNRFLLAFVDDAAMETESIAHESAARVVNSFRSNPDRQWTTKYVENSMIATLRNAVRDRSNEITALKRGITKNAVQPKEDISVTITKEETGFFLLGVDGAEYEYLQWDLATRIDYQLQECTNEIVEARIHDRSEKKIYRTVIESVHKLMRGDFNGRSDREIQVLGGHLRSVTKKSPPLFLLTRLVLDYLEAVKKTEMADRGFGASLEEAKEAPEVSNYGPQEMEVPQPLFSYKPTNGKIKGSVTVFTESKKKKTFVCIAPNFDEAKKTLLKLMEAS